MAAALCFLALGCAGRFTKLLSVLATILVLASAATECQSIEYVQFWCLLKIPKPNSQIQTPN